MLSGKRVKLNMRGIDRNRKGANHASSRQHPVGGAGRLMDGARLSGSRRAQLHHHYRYSVRIAIIQDGQACTLAVRRGNRQPVDSKYCKAAKATLDEAVTDVNNWIDQQAAKAE